VCALALPLVLILQEGCTIAATSGTLDNTIRPAQASHIIQNVLRIREVLDGLFQTHALISLAWHGKDYELFCLIRQVYYCP